MIARAMVGRDVPVRPVARSLGVDPFTLRNHVARPEAAPDGRRKRASELVGWTVRRTAVLQRFEDPRVGVEAMDRVEASVVPGVLRRAVGFTGSDQSVRRHLTRHYPARAIRAVRRVETPPGMQAPHDEFDVATRIRGTRPPLHGQLGRSKGRMADRTAGPGAHRTEPPLERHPMLEAAVVAAILARLAPGEWPAAVAAASALNQNTELACRTQDSYRPRTPR